MQMRKLGPGEEDEEREVFRCAQCLRIVSWRLGCMTPPSPALAPEEVSYLDQCCDDCWAKIVPVLEEAVMRLCPPGQQVLRFTG
jgi:hypothetical protein